jgi:hypothetical protein
MLGPRIRPLYLGWGSPRKATEETERCTGSPVPAKAWYRITSRTNLPSTQPYLCFSTRLGPVIFFYKQTHAPATMGLVTKSLALPIKFKLIDLRLI